MLADSRLDESLTFRGRDRTVGLLSCHCQPQNGAPQRYVSINFPGTQAFIAVPVAVWPMAATGYTSRNLSPARHPKRGQRCGARDCSVKAR